MTICNDVHVIRITNLLKDRNLFAQGIHEACTLPQIRNRYYPGYTFWYYNTVIPNLFSNVNLRNKIISSDDIFMIQENMKREILLLEISHEISGVAILKKSQEEKKLCTLFIKENARKKGYSKYLLEDAFKLLETETPRITIFEEAVQEFSSIIDNYNWKPNGYSNELLDDGTYEKEIIFN